MQTGKLSWDSADFQGAAHIFFLSSDYEKLKSLNLLSPHLSEKVVLSDRIILNMLVTGTDFQYADFDTLEAHVGDTFSHHFFGKSPIQINIKAKLCDTAGGFGKAELLELYHKVLRITAVAKYKIPPIFNCIGGMAKGAFLNLQVTENSQNWETLNISFEFLVFNMKFTDKVSIDYNNAMNVWNASKSVSPQAAADPEIETV